MKRWVRVIPCGDINETNQGVVPWVLPLVALGGEHSTGDKAGR
jgi:hypothetical protein